MSDTDELIQKAGNGDPHAQAVLWGRMAERLERVLADVETVRPALQSIYQKVVRLESLATSNKENLEEMTVKINGYAETLATRRSLEEHAKLAHPSAATKTELVAAVSNLRTELQSRFDPVRALVYAGVGIILTTVFTGMVGAALYFVVLIQGR